MPTFTPLPTQLKEVSVVHSEVSNLPVHLFPLRPSDSPTSLVYNYSQGSQDCVPLQTNQTSPLPGLSGSSGLYINELLYRTQKTIMNLTESLRWTINLKSHS